MPRRPKALSRRRRVDIQSADDELERYYREESSSRGGLFTVGGATAGGIFGDGPVIVQDHDAPSAHRHVAALGAARSGQDQDLRRELKQANKINRLLLKRLEAAERKQLSGRGRSREDEFDDAEEELDDDELDDDDDLD